MDGPRRCGPGPEVPARRISGALPRRDAGDAPAAVLPHERERRHGPVLVADDRGRAIALDAHAALERQRRVRREDASPHLALAASAAGLLDRPRERRREDASADGAYVLVAD